MQRKQGNGCRRADRGLHETLTNLRLRVHRLLVVLGPTLGSRHVLLGHAVADEAVGREPKCAVEQVQRDAEVAQQHTTKDWVVAENRAARFLNLLGEDVGHVKDRGDFTAVSAHLKLGFLDLCNVQTVLNLRLLGRVHEAHDVGLHLLLVAVVSTQEGSAFLELDFRQQVLARLFGGVLVGNVGSADRRFEVFLRDAQGLRRVLGDFRLQELTHLVANLSIRRLVERGLEIGDGSQFGLEQAGGFLRLVEQHRHGLLTGDACVGQLLQALRLEEVVLHDRVPNVVGHAEQASGQVGVGHENPEAGEQASLRRQLLVPVFPKVVAKLGLEVGLAANHRLHGVEVGSADQ